ncbi:MAG TPA: glycosyltransferase family 1 protein, partial [Candidatus Hydrogenedentes bacterium]|nr:glycosyltransferase family 1 protein [Candidatus Hydrogenedentota bacterium]
WSRICEQCSWSLVLAGRWGWKVNAIRKAIAEAPHRERIHHLGFVEQSDVPGLLSAARAFVWPSLWEGFGLPPLEAMACAVPVLTSCTSSLPEVVGDAGLLVEPTDTDAIADGMLRLAEDEALRERLAAAGPERAAGFTWRKTAEATNQVYWKALAL